MVLHREKYRCPDENYANKKKCSEVADKFFVKAVAQNVGTAWAVDQQTKEDPYRLGSRRGLQDGEELNPPPGNGCGVGWGAVPAGCSMQSGWDWAAHWLEDATCKDGEWVPGATYNLFRLICRDDTV